MSYELKVSTISAAEKYINQLNDQVRGINTSMHAMANSLKAETDRKVSGAIDHLRTETIQREQQIISHLKQDTQSRVNALEIKQREAMVQQANHFYQVVETQSRDFSSKLSHQSQVLGALIHETDNRLRNDMQEQGRVLNTRINDLRNETVQIINHLTESVNENFRVQEGKINQLGSNVNIIRRDLDDMIQREQDQQARATLSRDVCEAVWNVTRTHISMQKFEPAALKGFERRMETMRATADDPQSLTAMARQLADEILIAQGQAQEKQLLFDILYSTALANAQTLLEIMQRNLEETYFKDAEGREITDERGEKIKIQVDFWTDGAFSALEKDVEALRTELVDLKNDPRLNRERLDEILAQLNEYDFRQADLVTTAAHKGLLSEERVQISENIINALEERGYDLQKDAKGSYLHNYLGNPEKNKDADPREGVYAVLKNGENVEITLLINPDEKGSSNSLVVQRNDTRNHNMDELQHTMKFLRDAIKEEGYMMGEEAPPSAGDRRLPELADVAALQTKGISKSVKSKLAHPAK